METRSPSDTDGASSAPALEKVEQLLSELWAIVTGPDWAGRDNLREAIARTASLTALLSPRAAPRARRHAMILGQALERIGKGLWPSIPRSRVFLGECVRAVGICVGVSPFWTDEDMERLAATEPMVDVEPQPAEEADELGAPVLEGEAGTTPSPGEEALHEPVPEERESSVGAERPIAEVLVEPEDVVDVPDEEDEDDNVDSPAEVLSSSRPPEEHARDEIPFEDRVLLVLVDETV